MSRLILYAGPNGAGKSTLRDIGNDRVEIVIDPDRIARELSSMAPDAAAIEAGRLAIQLFRDAVTQGKTLSLESTLSGKRILNRLAAARRAEYVIELRYVALLSADLHIQRVAQRVRKSGHDIPAETIIRRYDQSLENLPKAISLSDRVVVIDNSGPKRQFLLRAENGRVLELATELPAWFSSRWPAIEPALGRRAK